ncbi:hypothetical protein EVAR_53209_1 [Eumeta japonica]|uniref:Uncharacterized protein n=1 Tax=Eumeta variegata TaxID=151549 RepID=A0A4C1XGG6_EUMVA|nr:hypothetical protein EVAR_53209_1 [Eumeta japonica]
MEMLFVGDGPVFLSWVVFLYLICRCYYQIGNIKGNVLRRIIPQSLYFRSRSVDLPPFIPALAAGQWWRAANSIVADAVTKYGIDSVLADLRRECLI